jgi:glyceraldehyde-3-phosphate dehydrogenase (NADP+)
MRIAWEEPFGPVLPILRVESVEAAVEHCNSNRLALQGCLFTRDVNQAIRISDAMETGTVQVRAPTCARLARDLRDAVFCRWELGRACNVS